MSISIILDHRIRDWVFLPIIFVMFMISVFRTYWDRYNMYKNTGDKNAPKSQTQIQEIVDKELIKKAFLLGKFQGLLPEQSFKMKRAYLCDGEIGLLQKASHKPQVDPLQQMQMNPSQMGDMMKKNLGGIVFMAVQYQWISYFFQGFVTGKMPFNLTQKFRQMLQKGIDIQNLDVRYISSLSIYFLMMFAPLNKVQELLFDEQLDETDYTIDPNSRQTGPVPEMGMPTMPGMGMPGMGMPGMPGMPGQQQDPGKVFLNEKARLEGIKYTSDLNKYTDKALYNLRSLL
ncbi:hypothetical protein pb186bvf_012531 [Paramecium bursaria]